MPLEQSAPERAHDLFERHLAKATALPIVDMSPYSGEECAELIRALEHLTFFIETIEGSSPFRLGHDGVGYDTPLGSILNTMLSWTIAQRDATVAALEAMKPAKASDQVERLVVLLAWHSARLRKDRVAELAAELQAVA
jgi:hypothetical protein